MTEESQLPRESAIIEANDRAGALVDQHMPGASEQVRAETRSLIEAIARKAQVEAQKAGEFALDNYLEAVRRARKEVEATDLFDPERIEQAVEMMRADAEKNWDALVRDVASLGDRVQDAARAAWDALTPARDDDADAPPSA
ncbi:hypothetical protein KR51_00007020 [Rubidibacter lacunae KORDI 51-2]|uniref:Uncharacterized protein n=1 Tax=Rubidibacter lacunae KORDI 51-2 TaxID=582515 RepID=U5DPU2_9CHRO|nr:hypothetical protein [Rubidibacter lacunae]ERN42609.1 hypothetical protein KR51_00007020 [Rubidibacter lacunae KORDI 51-2]